MNSLLQYLNQNPWLNLVFLVLSVLSIVISVILYFMAIKIKEPVYHLSSFNLINNKLTKVKNLKFLLNNQEINTMTLTRVVIWNKGRDVINAIDVAPTDPIAITTISNYEILQAEIIFVKTTANNFNLTESQGKIFVNFDYFYMGEGVVINVYHTGTSNDDIKILGTVKDSGSLKIGGQRKNRFTFWFLDNTAGRILIRGKIKPNSVRFIIAIIFAFTLTPILIPFAMLDFLYDIINRVPKEYQID